VIISYYEDEIIVAGKHQVLIKLKNRSLMNKNKLFDKSHIAEERMDLGVRSKKEKREKYNLILKYNGLNKHPSKLGGQLKRESTEELDRAALSCRFPKQ
jgi:hypothetical protein